MLIIPLNLDSVLLLLHNSKLAYYPAQSCGISSDKLLPYPLSLKQRSQETIFICPERGYGSGLIIAMSSTSYATPFAVYYDGIDVVKCT